jgi:copper chaperone CopZ
MKTLKFITIIIAVSFFISCNSTNPKTAKHPESKVKLTIKVGGMSCNNCEQTIQNKVAELPGIDSVKASYLDSTAVVYVDTIKSGIKVISQAIESKGYKVKSIKID